MIKMVTSTPFDLAIPGIDPSAAGQIRVRRQGWASMAEGLIIKKESQPSTSIIREIDGTSIQ